MMLKCVMGCAAVMMLAGAASGASVYTVLPKDADLVVLDKAAFPALHGDGVGDDSEVLQQAIAKAAASGAHVLMVPEGRYRVTRTIGIPPETRVLGFGAVRPVILLGAHTPGFDGEGPKYMVWFSGGNRRGGAATTEPRGGSVGVGFSDASAGTFYSGLSNIDFKVEEGNSGAVAIRGHFAQHGIISHVDFDISDGFAALGAVGNVAEDVHFHGGAYGVITGGTAPSWQYAMVDSSFDGQRVAAFKAHHTGLTLLRDRFENVPVVVAVDEKQIEQVWMKDCVLKNVSGVAVTIPSEGNVRMEINLADVSCDGVPVLARYPESGREVAGAGERYVVKEFSYGLRIEELGAVPTMTQTYRAEKMAALPAAVGTDLVALPAVSEWVSVQDFGAKGDGATDDTEAFRKAIAGVGGGKAVFVPHGRYRVTDTVVLGPESILIGLNPIATQIGIEDGENNFIGEGGYKAVIEGPKGGRCVVSGIGIDAGANNNRAAGLKWMAGAGSMVNDVKFLGGHGTWRPDKQLSRVYNADHSGDANPARKWDSEGPGLWVTDGGCGTFFNIWTASTFSSCGALIENTSGAGRMYEVSSEHHVRNEIVMRNVSNWEIYAQQTEEEWGEGPNCLPLEMENCSNLTFVNTIFFRVFGMQTPYAYGAKITGSKGIWFLGVRAYGQSAFNFDNPVFDMTANVAVRPREFGSLMISGNGAVKTDEKKSPVLAEGSSVEKVMGGLFSADHVIADEQGNGYFVDRKQNKVFKYDGAAGTVSVLRDDVAQPFALGLDKAGDLLILSHEGKAFALSLKDAGGKLIELKSVKAEKRGGMGAWVPADRWWDSGHFIETNARVEPLQFVSPDGSVFMPVPEDFSSGRQHNWTSQPIDLFRGYQLGLAQPGKEFFVADEYTHTTWLFTATDEGTLEQSRLFAQHGEGGVVRDGAGNVYIAEGEIFVYDAQGNQIDAIAVPERPLSMAFCGADRKTLLIAARGGVYRVRMK